MIDVNIVAILLAAIASMVVGFIYYSPFALGKPWMKLMGWSKDIKMTNNEMAKLYGTSFVLALITAFVLSHVMTMSFAYFNETMLTTGIMTVFWMWLGFIMPVQFTDVLFSKKPSKLFAINTGYQLISLLVMGVVISMVS
jgi:hypothetical protein